VTLEMARAGDTPAGGSGRRPSTRSLYGLVFAYGISQLGTSMSGLAIPWLVLVTTRSAAKTGLVGFAEMAPYVVVQAIAGPVVDRIGLRRSCITANAAAAVLVCAVPGLYALGSLSVGLLIAVVAVAGATRGAADAAASPLVPRSAALGEVPNERAAGMNSVAQRTGMLAGLPLAGVLIAATDAATVVLIDGVTFAVAALLITLLTPPAVDQAQAPPARAGHGDTPAARGLPGVHRAGCVGYAASGRGGRGAVRPGGRRAEPHHRSGRLRACPAATASSRARRLQVQRLDRDPVRFAAGRSSDRRDRPQERPARHGGGHVRHDSCPVRVPCLAGPEPPASNSRRPGTALTSAVAAG
jgi:hypothetical protein